MSTIFEVDSWLLGLDEELGGTTGAEEVVGGFGGSANFQRVFEHDISKGRCSAVAIADIPAKGFEDWVDKLLPCLGFVIGTRFILRQIPMEAINEIEYSVRCSHRWASQYRNSGT